MVAVESAVLCRMKSSIRFSKLPSLDFMFTFENKRCLPYSQLIFSRSTPTSNANPPAQANSNIETNQVRCRRRLKDEYGRAESCGPTIPVAGSCTQCKTEEIWSQHVALERRSTDAEPSRGCVVRGPFVGGWP